MKRIFTSLLFIFCLTVTNVFSQAVIKFEKSTHDFGTFPEEKSLTTIFKFTNTGDQPLVISQVVTSCGCTVADYTKTKIEPGKGGQIKVTYIGKGKPKGQFRMNIIVRSNASNATARIWITGNMTIKD